MSEKPTCTFSELIRQGVLEIGDGYRAKLDELKGDGLIFLRAGRLKDHGFDFAQAERFHEHLAGKVAPKVARAGDTIITTKGNSVGRTGYVPANAPEFVYSPHLSYWRSLNYGKLDPGFLRYWAQGPEFRRQLDAMAHGTDMAPYLSLVDQRQLRVALPAIARQRAIAEVLGTFDDKIEANDRIHDVCNDLAAAFLADLISRTASDGGLADGRLREVAAVNARVSKPGDGMLAYLDIASVGIGRAEEPTVMSWSEAPSRARRGVRDGDVLWSTVRPNRRSHCLVLDPPADLVASTGLAVLTPTSVGPSFLYGVTERPEFIDYLVSVAEGSAYPAVRADRFLEGPVPVPPPDQVAAYEDLTMPLRRRAAAALRESRDLTRLRDTLLPTLLSGELRVREVEALAGEAV